MANIRLDFDHVPYDGENVVFKAPCAASAVTGICIHYGDTSQTFEVCDAHGDNVGNIDNLFSQDAFVTIILDTDDNKAFVQNADTNAYLEGQLAGKADGTTNLLKPTLQTSTVSGVTIENLGNGTYRLNGTATAHISNLTFETLSLQKGAYKLTCCPSGASGYYVALNNTGSGGVENGSGATITVASDSSNYRLYPIIVSGTVLNNVVLKPMLSTNLSAGYSDFVQYTGDTGKLNSDVAELVKKHQGWELIGSVTGANSVNVSGCSEYLAIVQNSNGLMSIHIPAQHNGEYRGGYADDSANYNGGCIVNYNGSSISVSRVTRNNANVTTTSTMTVYGRR